MKQLLVLSGKGGTGKTTVASSFIALHQGKAFADCDVDAPNLHLVTKMEEKPKKTNYYGMEKAYIYEHLCKGCGECIKTCRFHAISKKVEKYEINPYACEGCSVCQVICPAGAIEMKKEIAGEELLYRGERVFSTATLKMGSGTSGKLVTQVKKNLLQEVKEKKIKEELLIIDGSPGIGCPVIASVAGVDSILMVTEPTVSGISDMKRVVEIAEHFQTPLGICVNKYDVNIEKTKDIEKYAKEKGIAFMGYIPYEKEIVKATNEGKTIIEKECRATTYMKEVYNNTMKYMDTL